jgi:hypothetical protein
MPGTTFQAPGPALAFLLLAAPLVLPFIPAESDDRDVECLVRQLGDSKFPKREAASTALAKNGEPALLALRKASA